MKVRTTGVAGFGRRTFTLGAVSVTAALVLSACGGGSDTGEGPNPVISRPRVQPR